MRSKILDQFKYVGSAGTAFDRTGFNSAIFVAIGGTSSTAIKVQHCDTSSGVFTDFATLVAPPMQAHQQTLVWLLTLAVQRNTSR